MDAKPPPRTPKQDPIKADNLLDLSLQFTKGVGSKRAELLNRLMLSNIRSLLHFFPASYKDRAKITPLAEVKDGEDVNVWAQIIDVQSQHMRNGKQRIEALLQDSSGQIRASWWTAFIARRLTPGGWGVFCGKANAYRNRVQLASPEFEIIDVEKVGADAPSKKTEVRTSPDFSRIVPVYSLRPKRRRPDGVAPPEIKLSQSFLRKLVWSALDSGAVEQLLEQIPEALLRRHEWVGRAQAIRQMHFPDDFKSLEAARDRLAYEELLILSLGVAVRKAQRERSLSAKPLPLGPTIRSRIQARLPYELTEAQKQAFEEIAADTGRGCPMNRLLQGDVGSGKTLVAVASMLLAIAHGAQAALLAPTEVLADQHFNSLQELLKGSRVQLDMLRGGAKSSVRDTFLANLREGRTHIAVGTHALLQPSVLFRDLAMVVVDEQHKFGVAQRQALRDKGPHPHVLVMTATPIPRTLSLTLYGDLDVSVMKGFPPGHGTVRTRWAEEEDRPGIYERVRQQAAKGRFTYVVLPRIEEMNPDEAEKKRREEQEKAPKDLWSLIPKREVKGVENEVNRLRKELAGLKVEALHGRMASDEKDQVLSRIRSGEVDVLVSTQLIEVGIDVAHANTMIVENAERFGLASLHQLRGRIGRSKLAVDSTCFFFADAQALDSVKRLKAFEKCNDGFEIAEADFELRGPGQFFGTEQSGLPEFLVADLVRDRKLLDLARADAQDLVRRDERLLAKEHAGLRQSLQDILGYRLELLDVG